MVFYNLDCTTSLLCILFWCKISFLIIGSLFFYFFPLLLYYVLQVEDNRKCRVHHLQPDSAVETSDYIKTKHIFLRTDLPRSGGRFVVVPTTFNPNETTEFLLRIFTEASANVKELKLDKPRVPWYKRCCVDEAVVVTRLTVVGVKGLENNERFGGKIDPYVVIKCPGQKAAKSRVRKNTLKPEWNFRKVSN